ncbi:aminotransferase class I/II-fold pyridoxal phosphate-dependent enzyme [uncultured Anaerococcus sp.]|uniref:aminotransferase class I/II-fold pyridoxal phosphate-dependent enzyme n=1 Tax=uncultured Anaerococcus sp. TaxID=293428 RepID=UPI002889E1BC|nr:aminotransferase class I/II-fold pyridoxal phosphate-dependent enzyme [uncultured Anaerococcus sp.]
MLNEKLDLYLEENYYPFHMPGSKRSELLRKDLAYVRDLTEIDGFDNLNDPSDIFIQMQEEISKIYEVKKSIISTNGSTCGILACLRALTYTNKNILIQRSSHKAVYNACELNQLKISYLNVKTNDISAIVDINYDDLENKLSKKKYACLVVTSPSYEGYLLDLDRIYKLCQKYSTKLVVDMAHGSHLPITDTYSKSFDIAISSFHKNLSALTPGAVVLINDLEYFDEIKRNMAIFQTSSPSYLILQSIDEMLDKFPQFHALYENLNKWIDDLLKINLGKLQLIDCKNKDKTKILISTQGTNLTGHDLANKLKEKKIEVEMTYPNYVLLISTIFDRKEGFDRLKKSLIEIDKNIIQQTNKATFKLKIPIKKMEIYETINKPKKLFPLKESLGKISASFLYAYPPGIPIIAPGELIDEDIIKNINFLMDNEININIPNNKIACIIDKTD